VNLLVPFLQIIFWLASFLIVYTFVGYGILLTLLARVIHRPIQRAPITPTVSLIIPAHDEEHVLAEKIENCFALDYARDRLEIIFITDGSQDRTNEIARAAEARGVHLLYQPERRGKIAAMNRAVPFATGDILIFSDADAMIEPPALRALVENFADPQVACVGGVKRIRREASAQARGEGAYWRYEAYLKKLDSQVCTAIGAIGELFAVRRELYRNLDDDLLIEDFVLSIRLVAQGWRVVYEPRAITWQAASPSLRGEWERRVRMATGGFQAMARLTQMLNPARGFPAFQYVSHKVLRWLAPFFMLAAFVANLGLIDQPLYAGLLAAQIIFYALALIGWLAQSFGVLWTPLQIPFYFCFANATSLAGLWRYLRKTQPITWVKART